jgi:hypothetical protein
VKKSYTGATATRRDAGRGREETTEDKLLDLRQERLARRKKHSRRRKTVIALVVIGIITAFIGLNWDKMAPASVADTVQGFFSAFGAAKYPLMLSSGNFKEATPIGNNIAVLTDMSLTIYSQSGAELAQRPHGMSDPQIVSAGGKAVLYDRGGTTFKVETRFDEPFSASAEYPIISAAMSRSGEFAVVTESEGYLGELTVYDQTYKSIFKWYSSQGRIVAASLSPDGSKVAAVVLSSVNGEYRSSIYIFNTRVQKPLSATNFDGTLLFSIQYTDNDEIASVGDFESVFLSQNGKKKSEYTYDGKTLKCYTNSNGATALVFGTHGVSGGSELISLSGAGRVAGKAAINSDVGDVFANGGIIAALTDSGIWHSDTSCRHAAVAASTGGEIAALPLKGNIYVFGLQSVYQYSLTQ